MLKKIFITLGLVTALITSAVAERKMDVLFIALDDMNDWTTLFDKDNPIQTPNLQRLAARGMFFSRAYTAAPVCNPSRTAVLTGILPKTSGVTRNGMQWKDKIPDAVTLPLFFKQNGYDSIGGGKIFHHIERTGGDRKDQPSFDDVYELQHLIHAAIPNRNGFLPPAFCSKPNLDFGEHDAVKQTDEYTIEYINKVMAEHPKDKPLFLAAGIFRPHLPFLAPPETFKRYPLESLQMPEMPEDDLDDLPPAGLKLTKQQSHLFTEPNEQEPGTPGSFKRMVQSYQAASDYSDEMVGRLLDQLDATGRADNTIIILWSDHGYHIGDKNLCIKHTLWEKANRVPFIVVAPGVTTPGVRCDRPVSLVDIYPTLVELAGLKRSETLEGQSLVPLLKNPKLEWDRPALMSYEDGNHAIRTEDYRYIRYADGSEELYSDEDPWNINNLARNSKMNPVLIRHRRLMEEAL